MLVFMWLIAFWSGWFHARTENLSQKIIKVGFKKIVKKEKLRAFGNNNLNKTYNFRREKTLDTTLQIQK
ncbi:hypothetical protein BpHYR1_050189 [Brachionus plicatilis]|uniref:Uncharacterized protein n=1 Tax=Brachionus plicatilis TaxID=10195 RepID=A0A3M7R0C2_BRAPC|nr:hypothetical protein BpHYR1_050189 [Brachionus plicatilis]